MAPIRSSYFDISLEQNNQTINITMHIPREDVTTTKMPYVSKILKKQLPTILRSKCFNEGNIPFYKEVISTELGHLFEHIMLEYLCIAKISLGFQEAMFSGITRWDWNKDPYGTFHIELEVEKDDLLFVSPALNKTIRLFEQILLYPQSLSITRQNLGRPTISATA